MFIQAAIDGNDLGSAVLFLKELSVNKKINFFEVGTSLLLNYGSRATSAFIEVVSCEKCYCDTKTIDFPADDIKHHNDLGVRRFSFMAGMEIENFKILRDFSLKKNIDIFVSTMGFPLDKLKDRILLLRDIGIRKFICHGSGLSTSVAFSRLLNALDVCNEIEEIEIIAAGGIGSENVAKLVDYNICGMIIGRGLRGFNWSKENLFL